MAVSGGKDSLALWDVLLEEGYETTGLYLDLGIFEYSAESKAKCQTFADGRGVPLLVSTVADEVGAPVPVIKEVTRRPPCSGCGLSKRYLMNRVALEHGFPVVATGHNLDDEAATLFGSVMHWQMESLPRQSPALPASHPKLVRRVKPLYRLSEQETAAYAFLRKIDYIVDECPFAKGATSIAHKEILNRMEAASPGAKHNFLFGFLDRGARGLRAGRGRHPERVRPLWSGHHGYPVRVLQARRPGEAVGGHARPSRVAFDRPVSGVSEDRSRPSATTSSALGADYALFMVGLSFASQATILPAFAAHLGASNLIIGAIPALMTLGLVPPLAARRPPHPPAGTQASARASLHRGRARPLSGPGRPRVRDRRARSRLHAHRDAHHAPGVHGHGRGADAGLAGHRGAGHSPRAAGALLRPVEQPGGRGRTRGELRHRVDSRPRRPARRLRLVFSGGDRSSWGSRG